MATSTITGPVLARGTKAQRRKSLGQAGPMTYLVAFLFVGICLAPVLYIILGGFRTNSEITVDPAGFPIPFHGENYAAVLASSMFWRQIGNSALVSAFTTLGVVVLGVMASYPIARYPFRARGAMYSFFAAGLMFPMAVAITPLYIMIKMLGLMNTHAGIILPQIAFGLPTTIIILVPFLRAIPKELEEAAAIDGASRLGFFMRMVVPLSVPGVVTTGILAFVGSWNAYLLPLFILNNESAYTLPLGVQSFASQYSVDTAKVLAFTSLSMIPALIFFSLFERRIVGGLTGAVKG